MIYVHEVHEILGGKMAEFGEAVRAEWRPLVEEGDGARLLWFWQLAHGTGASYQASAPGSAGCGRSAAR